MRRNILSQNALLLGCIASTFALPLWYGMVVLIASIPADTYLIYCAAIASSDAALPPDSIEGVAEVIFSARAVELKYLTSTCLAFGVFVWLTLSNRALHASLQQVAMSNSKERYIAALSHDFGTPIAALDLALKSFDAQAEAAIGEEVLSGIKAAVRTLSIVKGKALNISRMHAGETLRPNRTATSVRAVFVELDDLARLMYKRAGVSIHFWVDADVAKFILTDRDWLMMMLVNLISNALKFTAVGEVGITATRLSNVGKERGQMDKCAGADELKLTVADTGTGVPSHLVTKLFTEWTSASRWGSEGSGLGLCHVKQLACALGGSAAYAPNEPEGAVFSIVVPHTPVPELEATTPRDAEACASTSTTSASSGSAPGARLRPQRDWESRPEVLARLVQPALLVDDDPTIRLLTSIMLARAGATAVQTACDGLEAAGMLCTTDLATRPRWVLLDVQMPFVDGCECIRRVRTWEQQQQQQSTAGDGGVTPILAVGISANGDNPLVQRDCLAAGMDYVLAKPLDMAEFAAVLMASGERFDRSCARGTRSDVQQTGNAESADGTAAVGAGLRAPPRLEGDDGDEADGALVLDRAGLRQMVGGSEEAVEAVLATWMPQESLGEIANGIEQLQCSPHDGAMAIATGAHRLKGVSRCICAHRCEAAAARLENLARTKARVHAGGALCEDDSLQLGTGTEWLEEALGAAWANLQHEAGLVSHAC